MKKIKETLVQELPFLLCMPAILWQILFLVIPFSIILLFSFIRFTNASWVPLFTLDHYRALIDPVYFGIILRSLVLAGGTAIASFLCGYPVAYFLALRVHRAKNFLLFLLTLPFWTSFLIQIYSWFFLLERYGLFNKILLSVGLISEPIQFANSLFAVFLVMIYCYLPFMIMPLYSSLTKVDRRTLEASADLGATHIQTFFRVTLPITGSGIKTGLMLVLVPVFGDFAIPALLGGSKYMMVGSLISYYFLVARNNPQGAAFTILAGIALFVVILIGSIVMARLFARFTRGARA